MADIWVIHANFRNSIFHSGSQERVGVILVLMDEEFINKDILVIVCVCWKDENNNELVCHAGIIFIKFESCNDFGLSFEEASECFMSKKNNSTLGFDDSLL